MQLAEDVYRVTRGFPPEERFGLTNQCRRAAVSIAANLAEGHGRHSAGYFAQFIGVAQGSTSELDTELELAFRLGYFDDATWVELQDSLDHISRVLMNLRRTMRKRRDDQQ